MPLLIVFHKSNNIITQQRFIFYVESLDITSIFLEYGIYRVKLDLKDALGVPITVRDALMVPKTIRAFKLFIKFPELENDIQFGALGIPPHLMRKTDDGNIVFFNTRGEMYKKGDIIQAEANIITEDDLFEPYKLIKRFEKKLENQKSYYKSKLTTELEYHNKERQDLKELYEQTITDLQKELLAAKRNLIVTKLKGDQSEKKLTKEAIVQLSNEEEIDSPRDFSENSEEKKIETHSKEQEEFFDQIKN